MKAWRIIWNGAPNDPGIWIADTRNKATAKAIATLVECGYVKPRSSWKCLRLSCRRSPEYDAWAATVQERHRGHGRDERILRIELESRTVKEV